MRRLLPFRKPKLKPSTGTGNTLLEGTWIALCALRDSADAFPPLKSAVGGVVALWEIAKVISVGFIITIGLSETHDLVPSAPSTPRLTRATSRSGRRRSSISSPMQFPTAQIYLHQCCRALSDLQCAPLCLLLPKT
jgi:hypothetical protein